jgi:hypothetical protein
MATTALERSLVEIVGAPVPEGDSVLTPGALEFVATLVREFARGWTSFSPSGSGVVSVGARGSSSISSRDRGYPKNEWRVAGHTGRSRTPNGRNHWSGRSQDGDQRAQLGRRCLHGRLRGCDQPHLVEPGERPGQPARCGSPKHRLHRPHLGQAVHARGEARGAVSCVPVGFTCPSVIFASMGRWCPDLWWTSVSTSTTTPGSCSSARRAPTSTSPSSRATSRRAGGTTSSCGLRSCSGFPPGPSGRPC